MKKVELKNIMYHPKRGRFDFVRVKDEDFVDKGDHLEVKSAVSQITYQISKDRVASVIEEEG